jgi:tRNA(Arg) A34 adenosine deaminase TadA
MKKLRFRFTNVTLTILVFAIIVFFIFPFLVNQLKPSIRISRHLVDSLISLQNIAADKGEYPVSALLVYKDSVIGTGYNTFRNLNDPLGHAEINALINAFESYNYYQFRALDRDSLVMLTSYEPCIMCKGIICHHEIRHVYYLKPKSVKKNINYRVRDLRYYFRLRKIKAD